MQVCIYLLIFLFNEHYFINIVQDKNDLFKHQHKLLHIYYLMYIQQASFFIGKFLVTLLRIY